MNRIILGMAIAAGNWRRLPVACALWAGLAVSLLLVLTGCYHDEEHEKNMLNGLLVNELYTELDKALAKGEARYRQKKISPRQWTGRWASLVNINADGIITRFDGWVSATGSGYAHLGRGMFLQSQAWAARGDKIAARTSQAQFAEFRRLAKLSEADLLAARQQLAGCALCAAQLININRALGQTELNRALLEEALLIDPAMRSPVIAFSNQLYPQWGGSLTAMLAYMDEMRERVADPNIIAELESLYCWEQGNTAAYYKDDATALAWFERGFTAQPDDMLMKHLAETYTELGRHRDAARVLEANLRLNDAWDLYTVEALAQAYFRSGEQAKGEAMMRRRDELQERYDNFE